MKITTKLSKCLWSLLSLLLTLCIFLTAGLLYLQIGLPNVATLQDTHMQVPMRIYSSDHKLMGEFGLKKRTPVALNEVPKQLIQAVLATEDARYYEHSGVDVISLFRAAKAVILTGKKVQGASTITMQVARNFFLSHKKTYTRKLREIILALKIDHEMSKNAILTLYLNKIFLGHRAYGVAAAAQVYYGKPLNQLNLAQIAMIAGLPQAPSAQNPLSNPHGALERRNHVLERMLDVKYITKQQYQQARAAPITASFHRLKIALPAPYVTELVRRKLFSLYGNRIYEDGLVVETTIDSHLQQAAQKTLDAGALNYTLRHGFFHPQISLGIYSPDDQISWAKTLAYLPIYMNLQPAAIISQNSQSAQALLRDGRIITLNWPGLKWARPYQKEHTYPGFVPKTTFNIFHMGDVVYVQPSKKNQWKLTQIPQVQGALISIHPNNGNILALVGGLSYQLSHFDRATQAVRQPGSNFKPFIYSAALSKGMTLATMINDAPIVIADSGENSLWRPQNDNLKFYGPTSIRMGLIKSRNVVSVRVLQTTGLKYTLNYIKKFGFNIKKLPHSLSLALGSGGITPIILARGYTTFANGGYLIKPHLITRVQDEEGKVLFDPSYPIANHSDQSMITTDPCETTMNSSCSAKTRGLTPPSFAKQTVTPQNAYLITHALEGVIQQGTGRRARSLHRSDLAGKTGTTNDQLDAWFSGYNSQIETTVWLGFDDAQRSLHEYAASSALPIWIDYMRQALKNMPNSPIPMPTNIVTARIDPENGLLAPPSDKKSIFEVFRKGHAPNQFAQLSNNNLSTGSNTSNMDTSSSPLF